MPKPPLSETSSRFRKLCLSQISGSFFVFGLGILFAIQNRKIQLYGIDIISTVIGLFLVVAMALVAYRLWGNTDDRIRKIAVSLLAADTVIVSVITHFSGGIDSLFSSLNLVLIIAAGIVVSRPFCLKMAIFASVLYIAQVAFEAMGVSINPTLDPVSYGDIKYVIYVLILKISLFQLAALLSMYFMGEIDVRNKKLSELTLLHDHVIRNMKTGMVILNPDRAVIFVNPAALTILGVSEHDIIGKHFDDIMTKEAKAKLEYVFRESGDDHDRPRNFEIAYVQKDRVMDIGFSISALRDSQGTWMGYIFLFQDISMKKAHEQNLMKIERHNALGKMAVTIAHELRNPLASLSGSAEILREKLDVPDDHKKLLDVIIKESRRLNKIVTDFLEFSRTTAPRFHIINLKELIDEIIMILRYNEKIPLEARFEHDIAHDQNILGDTDQLKQAFNNLIFNAVESCLPDEDHNHPPRVKIYSERTFWKDKPYIRVSVKDWGCGIAPENHGKIFQEFFTTKINGTGLGLAVVKNIVEAHQGRIEFETQPRNGTVFNVLLPKAPPD